MSIVQLHVFLFLKAGTAPAKTVFIVPSGPILPSSSVGKSL